MKWNSTKIRKSQQTFKHTFPVEFFGFGFRFQPSKQMFGAGYGEFLRILYNPLGGLGYAVRSLVNYH